MLTLFATIVNHSIFRRSQVLIVRRNCDEHVAAIATDIETGNLSQSAE